MLDAVLVTRPEPGASETADRLVALGFKPILAPCLTVAGRAGRLPGSVAAVLVTSGQAVGVLPALYHGLPLLGVGDATARRAMAAGFACVHSADGDAGDLLRLAVARLDPAAGAVLLASGAGQGLALAAGLRAAGFRVVRRVVYRAQAATGLSAEAWAALRGGEVHAALFFSAETARAFVRMLAGEVPDGLTRAVALAMGHPAAEVLRVLPWREVRVALRPTQEELLALL